MPGGRPKKGHEPLTERVTFRVTKNEMDVLQWLARKRELGVAELVRLLLSDDIYNYTPNGLREHDVPPKNWDGSYGYSSDGPGQLDIEYYRKDRLIVTHRYRDGKLTSQEVGSINGQSLWLGNRPPEQWIITQGGREVRLRVSEIVGKPGDDSVIIRGKEFSPDTYGWEDECEVAIYADGRDDCIEWGLDKKLEKYYDEYLCSQDDEF